MPIRVPVNPSTRPAQNVLGFNSGGNIPNAGAAIAEGLSSLGQSLQRVQDRKVQEQKQLDAFELNHKATVELNELQQDFQQRQLTAEAGAPDFAASLATAYDARRQKLIDEATAAGYHKDAVQVFATKLDSVNSQFFGKALEVQESRGRQNSLLKLDPAEDELSRYVVANPEGIESARTELRGQIDLLPGLTVEEKEAEFLKRGERLNVAAGTAYGMAHPRETLTHLAPHLLKQESGGLTPILAVGGRSSNEWANVAVDVANEWGLDPKEVAAIFSFETGGTFSPTVTNASGHMGLIQFGKAEQAKYGIDKNSTAAEWTTAINKFFKDRGLQKGAKIDDVYSTILTGRPGNYDAADSNGTTVRNAVPRILAEHKPKAEAWLGLMSAAGTVPLPAMETPHGYTALVPPRQKVDPDTGEPIETPGANDNAPIKTGIPALDLLTGPQQLQVINQARAELSRHETESKSAVQVKFQNAIAGYQTTGDSQQRPSTEEMLAAGYEPVVVQQMEGTLNAAAKAGTLVKALPTLPASTVNASVEALKPTDTSSATFKTDMETYEHARQAAEANLKARTEKPFEYVTQAFPSIAAKFEAGDRRGAYVEMENAYRKLEIPQDRWLPVPADQVEQIAQNYDASTAPQKLQALEQWLREMPPKLWVPFMVQMNGNDGRGPGYDIFMHNQLQGHPQHTELMKTIFTGQSLVKENPDLKLSENEVASHFPKSGQLALTGLNATARRIYGEAAGAIYAARGGQTGKGAGGVDLFNTKLYEDSLRWALGGLKDDPNTGFVRFHGGNEPATILPKGVNKQEWERRLHSQTMRSFVDNSLEGKAPVTKFGNEPSMQDIIDDGVFVLKAPGHYAIKFVGQEGYLKTRTGKDFILKVRP